MKIAANIIVGDNCDLDDWLRCVDSLQDKVDGLYVVYNGILDDIPYPMPDMPHYVEYRGWDDDFSAQRNACLAATPKMYDWILWIDTDDTLEGDPRLGIEQIRQPEHTQGIFARYDYGVDPDTGTVMVTQWRERLLRTDANWVWQYPVHEVCHAPANSQFARSDAFHIKHWRQADEGMNSPTRIRNRRILVKARREHPDVPRFTYYLANEVFAEAYASEGEHQRELCVSTIELYRDFVRNSAWDDDSYTANHRCADCHRLMGDHVKAVETDLQGIKLMPDWPDSYMGLAVSFYELGDMDKAAHWARVCKSLTDPITTHVRDPVENEAGPDTILGCVAEARGDYTLAREHFSKALINGGDSAMLQKRMVDMVAKAWNVATAPEDSRMKLRGTRPEKSIAFFTQPLFEDWHPVLEAEHGSGGAEKCIMELAPRFAADGWRVVVFGTPGEHRGVDSDGVEWWRADEWLNTEEFTVVVSSRAPQLFDANVNAKLRFLWMHDVNVGTDPFTSPWGNRMERTDAVVALTHWHATHLKRLYDIPSSKLEVIHNGIDISRFDGWDAQRGDGLKLVYSSSPDRGLDTLVTYWDLIQERLPGAELHVFYGWEAIDKIIAGGSPHAYMLSVFRDRLLKAIGECGDTIKQHGRVPQAELAQHLLGMDVWAYPTYFMETFCITALEMQAAGVIPVTSHLAGLKETVACASQRLKGNPNNADYRDRWLDLLAETALDDDRNNAGIRAQGRSHAERFTWDVAYGQWQNVISRRLPGFTGVTGTTSLKVTPIGASA